MPLTTYLDARGTAEVADFFFQELMQAQPVPQSPGNRMPFAADFVAILTRDAHSRERQAVDMFGRPVPPSPAQKALPPLPPPLPAQDLVDLLKHPLCVGEARRSVLDQLGRHHDRRFADVWEFVDFARQQRLDLNLATPPQRLRSGPAGTSPQPPRPPRPTQVLGTARG